MAKLSSDHTYITVEKGDTLSQIYVTYKSYISSSIKSYKDLAEFNDISNPDKIYIGQKIKLSGTATQKTKNSTSSRAKIKEFGLQSDTDRTVFATWAWDKDHTDNYKVMWYYATGDGVSFVGEDTTTTYKQSTYTAPSNATKVKFKVKPVSKKHKVNKKDTSYWTASWSTEKTYSFSSNPPSVPPVPTITIENLKLTADLNNLDINATSIEFQIVKNDSKIFRIGKANIITKSASYSCSVDAGGEYKVRCRGIRGKEKSDWSEYSNSFGTQPAAPTEIKEIKAKSETEVYLDWANISNADTYEIQYTTKKMYFDSNPSEVTTTNPIDAHVASHAEITGLTSGQEYFFRLRASNDKGNSSWSPLASIIIGKAPDAPTTWSSTTTAVTGDPLFLYWVHNTEDGSSQTYAELELIVNGNKTIETIENATDPDKKDKTSSKSISTSIYTEGTTIKWRVRTKGIIDKWSPWSTQRTIDIYATPTLSIEATNSSNTHLYTLTSFPFYVRGVTGPNSQKPIGYHLSVISNDKYETVDNAGNPKFVRDGEELYSNFFDTNQELLVEFTPSNISFENNISYTIRCIASMDSGLTTAPAEHTFTVSWDENVNEPNAEIAIDRENLVAHINPYCKDEDGALLPGITLSVYRRDFDGRLTEIETGIDNLKQTYVTDIHPALDFARYRIVATSTSTGAISYYDMPGEPVGESSIVVQWDETWSSFDVGGEPALEVQPWSASSLKLPYNVDISESNNPDIAIIEYIGRAHPVSYYGTQLGIKAIWNAEIPKEDKETIYALRRLAVYMGDVYVREPSGIGYYANVKVSFPLNHGKLTVPVTLEIARVERGIRYA